MLADFIGLAEVIFSEIASPCFGAVVDALMRINECAKLYKHHILQIFVWNSRYKPTIIKFIPPYFIVINECSLVVIVYNEIIQILL